MFVLSLLTALAADPEQPDSVPVETPAATPVNAPLLGRPYTPTKPGQITVDSPYWDLEVYYATEQHLKGQKIAEERYSKTQDPHLTLHIARFIYQRLEGEDSVSKSERLEQYDYALETLEKGIAADPSDIHLKFAKGVVLARAGTTRGVLASLRYATTVEKAWTDTIESDFKYHSIGQMEQLPCDAYLALGIFYRLVPDWWIVKAISGTRGDLDKSLQMTSNAVLCEPNRIRNLKELGVTQLCIGTNNDDAAMIADGKKTIATYLTMTPTAQEEVVDIKHGKMLIENPKMACEYSRDGQQDLDEAKLKKE